MKWAGGEPASGSNCRFTGKASRVGCGPPIPFTQLIGPFPRWERPLSRKPYPTSFLARGYAEPLCEGLAYNPPVFSICLVLLQPTSNGQSPQKPRDIRIAGAFLFPLLRATHRAYYSRAITLTLPLTLSPISTSTSVPRGRKRSTRLPNLIKPISTPCSTWAPSSK